MIDKKEILNKAKCWFKETIALNHEKNTNKLSDSSVYNINPFLLPYLANFLDGEISERSLAKALIYPRALGTSINTSFGTNMQYFTSEVLSSFGSLIPGIDIEFVDQISGKKIYCQLKSGPNTINNDDVETISNHFASVRGLAKTNKIKADADSFIIGVLYGEEKDLSGHYKRLDSQYHYGIVVGRDFWHRLTGDSDFYYDLIESISEVAIEINFKSKLDDIIDKLATSNEIKDLAKKLNS